MCVFVLWTSCLRAKIHYYYMRLFAKKLYHGWISTMTSSNEISWKLSPPEMKRWLRPWDTVWHGGLTCKLLRLLPDRHMVRMIMEMVGDGSFTLTTGNGIRSRLRCLKNGVQQGSVLAPLLFNIYIYDLATTVSTKYAYADDLAIMHVDGVWQAVEAVLSTDMATVGEYRQIWKLKLSITKTVSTAFYLNNKEAKRELKVNFNNETLPFCSEPKYLGVTLDRSFTYRRHLESLPKKLTSRVALLRRLVGSGWGTGATTQQIATLIWRIQLQSTAVLSGTVVLVPALSTPPSATPCELWLDACVQGRP